MVSALCFVQSDLERKQPGLELFLGQASKCHFDVEARECKEKFPFAFSEEVSFTCWFARARRQVSRALPRR